MDAYRVTVASFSECWSIFVQSGFGWVEKSKSKSKP